VIQVCTKESSMTKMHLTCASIKLSNHNSIEIHSENMDSGQTDVLVLVVPIPAHEFVFGTPEDIAHAGRFQLSRRRSAFLIGRHLVRTIGGSIGHAKPEGVRIVVSSYGKPGALLNGRAHFQFSISHSDLLVGIAIRRHGYIGFDLEPISEFNRARTFNLANAVNNQLATSLYFKASGACSPEPELDCWVGLESISKYLGCGLDSQRLGAVTLEKGPHKLWYGTEQNHRLAICTDHCITPKVFRIERPEDFHRELLAAECDQFLSDRKSSPRSFEQIYRFFK
jgi:phosphopantetheinyl transferase